MSDPTLAKIALAEIAGLTSAEVEAQIAAGKQNKSSETRSKQINEILAENLFSVFNLIVVLIVGTLIFYYFRTGDIRLPLDATGVFAIAFINTALAIFQEIRAKRALDKVNLLLKRTVAVVRNNQKREIELTEIVVGDLIAVERGDQIAVDGRITRASNLEIDESLLTGESVPIFKQLNDEVLSGSFCVAGNGFYTAEKVGDDSYAAKVTNTAKQLKIHSTPLQKRIAFIVKTLFGVSIILIAFEFIFGTNQTQTEADFVRKLATLVISLVPHGLVLTASITFALGIYRISQIGAIVQKLNAVESFSNVKIVCADKTGTLTQNRLSIRRVTRVDEETISQAEVERLLGIYSELSSDKNATLRTLEKFAPLHAEHLRGGGAVQLIGEIPFSSATKMSLIEVKLGGKSEIFVLGGFDVLLDRIGVRGLRGKAERLVSEAGLEVYRNLMFGRVMETHSLAEIKQNPNQIKVEPLAVISISDEIRTDVLEAIKLFQLNGIELKILSGDAAESVRAIAHEIGWQVPLAKVVTGNQLDALNELEFAQAAREKSIFARLKPEHKLQLIQSLKRQKFYTAMLGDGVNDLPAIKEADLGIAMEEGSQITKEVADIVLLKNKFALLPQIFDEGNRIVNTVNSVAKLVLTKNFLVIYLAVAALAAGLNFPLTPRRVSLLNFFTILLPSFVIALRNRDTSRTRNFTLDLFSYVALSGFFVCAAGFAAEFAAERYFAASDSEVQVVMLTVMIAVAVANFYCVVLRNRASWNLTYLFYGLGIIGLFAFFVTTEIDFQPLNWIKTFSEITRLDSKFWATMAIISLTSSIALFFVQRIRQIAVKK